MRRRALAGCCAPTARHKKGGRVKNLVFSAIVVLVLGLLLGCAVRSEGTARAGLAGVGLLQVGRLRVGLWAFRPGRVYFLLEVV